jgi:hypothetical protein
MFTDGRKFTVFASNETIGSSKRHSIDQLLAAVGVHKQDHCVELKPKYQTLALASANTCRSRHLIGSREITIA